MVPAAGSRPSSRTDPSSKRLPQQASDVVRRPARARDEIPQGRVTAVHRVVGHGDRRQLPGVGRQIGQHPAHQVQRLGLGVGDQVDRAGPTGHLPAAELLVERLAHARLDDRGPRDEDLRQLAHHHADVTGDQPDRTEAGDRTERRGHDGHLRQQRDHRVPARVERHVGAAELLERLDGPAASRAVQQADDRHPLGQRAALDVDLLGDQRKVGGTTFDREVVAGHDDAPAVDPPGAGDDARRHEGGELAVVVGRRARHGADLGEAAVIEQVVEPLPHGAPTVGPLPGDAFGAAELGGQVLAVRELIELGVPDHRRTLGRPGGTLGRRRAWCGAVTSSHGALEHWRP